ncbi:hypothetical protein Kpol_483p12 [Vanderwaltozyma polyspora DSM 70294]|uniref:DNA repair protein RAD59 n=1 Tax=Vanderwaltozyma polyspora (strain ATCC 22028 / DSM 70294 / BCRC 21397 / CBS 2163 / NBRC 10782 / NRRL Y-8283 / UCD 57-17) TaxID=436907 RepID=A7TQ64_VANPO|nr:uncharacterized protein Kpol_483p12 [Vanderwaltozyma polyspora DSM 70294]EDO15593.1 hypothetical protein Kpol_483p12 [Vanderwaltozyma polyspora DSM 70294]
MSAYSMHNIEYTNTEFKTGPGIDLREFNVCEDWNGRPASNWSVQRIGRLQAKIEKYSYRFYHNSRYPKLDLVQLMPGHVLTQFANEVFGYDGWKMEVLGLEALECNEVATSDINDSKYETKFTVRSEAKIKLTLKDGTNTIQTSNRIATTPFKGESYSKSKKEAVTYALKGAFLSFEKIILQHEKKVENNYYTDGLYASRTDK